MGYLLRGATGCARGDIVLAIISIVRAKLLPDCRASSRCLVADRRTVQEQCAGCL
jgi:hypothetical protein